VTLAGIPVDFILFGLTLLGVALFHRHTLAVALTGLAVITLYKLAFTGFKTGPGLAGFGAHMMHEWVILTNLLCLLVGFALLSKHFEESRLPAVLPRFLPDDWKGGFALLVVVFVLSSFLDNIAAAMIGGVMIPLIAMPPWLLSLSNISPMKWAILSYEGAIWRGLGFFVKSKIRSGLSCGSAPVNR